jgi:dihydropteroate synthase
VISPRGSFLLPLPHRPPLTLGDRTLVMGVLNVTPDSFSDGGAAFDAGHAIARALVMEADGADIIDIGAESTRPGAEPVDAAEEWRRLHRIIAGLTPRLRIPLSVDTYRAETAARALDQGAAIINDISGLGYDAGLGAIVAARGAALILMHTRGRSRDMYVEARYDDVVADVARELHGSMQRAIEHGVSQDRLVIDPGLGFAKTAGHSMTALAHFASFSTLGRPLLSGPSRKSFLTSATGPLPPHDRDWATAAAVTASILAGAHIVRVHRVKEMVQVARVADALRRAGAP